MLLTGAVAGSSFAVVGAGRGNDGLSPFSLALWEVVTVDALGDARVDLELDVPGESSWVAVDLETGEIAMASADGATHREIELPSRAIPASLRTLDENRSRLVVLWARPSTDGSGAAWGGHVSDGSSRDADGGENRRLQVALDQLIALGASPAPPPTIADGDVLVGIDPDTLETYAARLVR